jgi:membrane protease YdiL (CAAX protease family)
MITRNGAIIDGYCRWELARRQGRTTVACIEYDLTEEEALHWLLQRHRRVEGLNAFCRILLALDLEPWLKEQARVARAPAGGFMPLRSGRSPLNGQQHTRALVRFFLFVMAFEWAWFFIAWAGIRRFGKVTFAQLVGGNWNRASRFFLDLGITLGVLVVSLALGTLLQEFLGRFESSSPPLSSMVPQNVLEAAAFLAAALTAGFVEEFAFRGYLQNQLTAFTGSVTFGSILQMLLFVQGHYFRDYFDSFQ